MQRLAGCFLSDFWSQQSGKKTDATWSERTCAPTESEAARNSSVLQQLYTCNYYMGCLVMIMVRNKCFIILSNSPHQVVFWGDDKWWFLSSDVFVVRLDLILIADHRECRSYHWLRLSLLPVVLVLRWKRATTLSWSAENALKTTTLKVLSQWPLGSFTLISGNNQCGFLSTVHCVSRIEVHLLCQNTHTRARTHTDTHGVFKVTGNRAKPSFFQRTHGTFVRLHQPNKFEDQTGFLDWFMYTFWNRFQQNKHMPAFRRQSTWWAKHREIDFVQPRAHPIGVWVAQLGYDLFETTVLRQVAQGQTWYCMGMISLRAFPVGPRDHAPQLALLHVVKRFWVLWAWRKRHWVCVCHLVFGLPRGEYHSWNERVQMLFCNWFCGIRITWLLFAWWLVSAVGTAKIAENAKIYESYRLWIWHFWMLAHKILDPDQTHQQPSKKYALYVCLGAKNSKWSWFCSHFNLNIMSNFLSFLVWTVIPPVHSDTCCVQNWKVIRSKWELNEVSLCSHLQSITSIVTWKWKYDHFHPHVWLCPIVLKGGISPHCPTRCEHSEENDEEWLRCSDHRGPDLVSWDLPCQRKADTIAHVIW